MSETYIKEPIFSWLHLSDIHFGHGDESNQIDQELVTNVIRTDIKNLSNAQNLAPNLIIVTGDISATGATRNQDEFSLAKDFLLDLSSHFGMLPSQVLHIPGNHDVQRTVAKENSKAGDLVARLRSDEIKIDAVYGCNDQKGTLNARFKNYMEFSEHFAPVCKNIYGWRSSITGPFGLNIRVAGLNSAVLSQDDNDNKKLSLGMTQIKAAINDGKVVPNDIVVVLSHHPFDWLRDEKSASGWIDQHAHFHLYGHNHDPDFQQIFRGGRTPIVKIAAGAIHSDETDQEGAPVGHSYCMCTLHVSICGKMCVRIWPRRWSDKNKCFMLDVDNVDHDKLYAQYRLPTEVSREAVKERFEHHVRVSGFMTLVEQCDSKTIKALEKYLRDITNDHTLIITDCLD